MVFLFGVCLYFIEGWCFLQLEEKYRSEGESRITFEEFISRANLEDIIKAQFHLINMWMGLGLASIGSLMK